MKGLADALVQGRRNATAIDAFPGDVPANLAESYAIQEAVIAGMNRPIRGWKIAMIHPDLRTRLGSERTTGPILDGSLHRFEEGRALNLAVYEGGASALEAEFALVLGKDISAIDTMPDHNTMKAAIASVHAAIEVASSPVAGIVELGPLATTSDLGINAGAVLGPAIKGWDWNARPEDFRTRAFVDGDLAGEGSAAAIPGGFLAALEFLLAQLASRGRSLKAGDVILTGMTNGVHKVRPGSNLQIEFTGTVTMDVGVIAKLPE